MPSGAPVLLLASILLLAGPAAALPTVERAQQEFTNDCEGTFEQDPPGAAYNYSTRQRTRCETTYGWSGVRVRGDDGAQLARVGVGDSQTTEDGTDYEVHDDKRSSNCTPWSCDWDTWMWTNESRASERTYNNNLPLIVETAPTGRVQLAWCDVRGTRHEEAFYYRETTDGQLTYRDDRSNITTEGTERCGYGVRAMGVEQSVYTCERTTRTTIVARDRYEDGVLVQEADGTSSYEQSCLLGVERDAALSGTGTPADGTAIGARVGYEELRRECYPACGPATEERITARAWVGLGGERADAGEDVPVDAPIRLS